MNRDLERRMVRLEQIEEAHRLTATARPVGLPGTSPATWGDAEMAELHAFTVKARQAGARRPLGWMTTPDLLALAQRMGVAHA